LFPAGVNACVDNFGPGSIGGLGDEFLLNNGDIHTARIIELKKWMLVRLRNTKNLKINSHQLRGIENALQDTLKSI